MKKIFDSISWFLMPLIRVLSRLNTQRVVRNKIRIRRDNAQIELIENTLQLCICQARFDGRMALITNYRDALYFLREKFEDSDFQDLEKKIKETEANSIKDKIEIAELQAEGVELESLVNHYYELEQQVTDPNSKMARRLLREK
jgi:hypothetical protein